MEAARTRGNHPDLVFAVGPVEMGFEAALRAGAKTKAGFKIFAIGAETEAGVAGH
ncbi:MULTISPECIES: trypco2 family protein [unclassified Streptomyces]|uniref:trypco2 family protein n=1 Tax=unclassified Streptomyces TaxID=2593676 RepID=UPI00342321B9